MNKIAIIIPAYKDTFLREALESISKQTCKDFMVYIGDDCSPHDIQSILSEYSDRIPFIYKRFETNIGSEDLVAQWERCISLSMGEPYIWLFSDDDTMEYNCVEELLKHIEMTKGKYALYHFDVNIIDENGCVIDDRCDYPPILNSYDYYCGKLIGRYPSYVVENIFSRKIYEETGGFINFDLAWGSDTATWTLFSEQSGIYKIPSARINWRRSTQNISPNKTRTISERKIMAVCDFLEWSNHYFSKSQPDIFSFNRRIFISRMRQFKTHISKKCFERAFERFFEVHGHNNYKLLTYLQIKL